MYSLYVYCADFQKFSHSILFSHCRNFDKKFLIFRPSFFFLLYRISKSLNSETFVENFCYSIFFHQRSKNFSSCFSQAKKKTQQQHIQFFFFISLIKFKAFLKRDTCASFIRVYLFLRFLSPATTEWKKRKNFVLFLLLQGL